jgi:hypothetical protein
MPLPSFQDKLPDDDISVPLCELPDPDADNGTTGESVRQQENKWNDLALNELVIFIGYNYLVETTTKLLSFCFQFQFDTKLFDSFNNSSSFLLQT